MPTDNPKAEIREFLVRSLGSSELADADDIFATGGATSLFAMELVMFVEDRFAIQLDDDDLDRENFKSVDAMASLIERKRDAPAG